MTFSLLGLCPRTGQVGSAVATSMIGTGGVLTQALADPGLALIGLDLLRAGLPADATLDAMLAATPNARWRQLAVLDMQGGTACFHGEELLPERGGAEEKGVVAIGNALASAAVPAAMRDAFLAAPGESLAERGLAAGHAAGGQRNEIFTAGLKVMGAERWPLVDLRVDLAPHPIEELRRLWEHYRPLADWFVARARDPANAGPRP